MRGKHFGNEMRDEIDAVVHQIRFLMVQFMKDTVFRDLFLNNLHMGMLYS